MPIKKAFYKIIIICLLLGLQNLTLAKEKPVRVWYKTYKDGVIKFFAENKSYAPYNMKLSFKKLINLQASKKLPLIIVLKGKVQKKHFLTLRRIDGGRYSYSYEYKYSMGDPKAKHNKKYNYLIPYKHGTKHKVTQGYFGSFTHYGKNTYSLDFKMPIGTPIYAARPGLVVKVVEKYNIGGPEKRFAKYGNKVDILHKDGSFASYVHFKQYGVVVREGQRVKKGQLIAYSGNTGRSSGPHLHFAVWVALPVSVKTIPTIFYHNKKLISLKEGHYYYSYHPGKPQFKTEYGSKIKNNDFSGYNKKIPYTGKIKFRSKKIDDTTIFFIRNGKKSTIKIDVDFVVENILFSKNKPHSIIIPGLSEVYFLFLRVKHPRKKWGYRYSYRYYSVRGDENKTNRNDTRIDDEDDSEDE